MGYVLHENRVCIICIVVPNMTIVKMYHCVMKAYNYFSIHSNNCSALTALSISFFPQKYPNQNLMKRIYRFTKL